jgi:hypothetical protein
MDKLIALRIQASLLRIEIRSASALLRAHERQALKLRSSLERCEHALVTLRALLHR